MAKFAGVAAVEITANPKLGGASVTFVSQETCPKTCALRGTACYAEWGSVGIHRVRLNRESSGLSSMELSRNEAAAVEGLSGKRPLRLHVVGDCTDNYAAHIVAESAAIYSSRHDQTVWTYTHAWRDIYRANWGYVSVLASCETTAQVRDANTLGYSAAILVDSHAGDKAYMRDGLKILPCPEQTGRAANCLECGLCLKDDLLLKSRLTIAFALHGRGTTNGKNLLKVLN